MTPETPTPPTQPCSDEDIAQIEAALAKATPGPWGVLNREPRYIGEIDADFIHAGVEPKDDTGFDVVARMFTTHGYDGVAERKDNAALIVLLRNNAEALLASAQAHKARAEEAERERDEAQSALEASRRQEGWPTLYKRIAEAEVRVRELEDALQKIAAFVASPRGAGSPADRAYRDGYNRAGGYAAGIARILLERNARHAD